MPPSEDFGRDTTQINACPRQLPDNAPSIAPDHSGAIHKGNRNKGGLNMAASKKTESTEETQAPAMLAAMMAVNPVVTKDWLDIMSESTRFISDRLQKDLETQKALLKCKSPTELIEVQSEFFKTAMEQYAAEATRLFAMMTQAGEDTIEEAGKSRTSKYDDVPL